MNLQASTSSRMGQPVTPGRKQQQGSSSALLRESVNNNIGTGSYGGGMTPNNNATASSNKRRITLTPQRVKAAQSPGPAYAPLSMSISGHPSAAAPSSSQASTSSSSSIPPLKYRIVAEDPQLKAVMEQDAGNCDASLKNLREGKSERRRQHESLKVELLEEERWWESEGERLRKEGAQIVKTLEREKIEVADAQSIVTSLENRRRTLTAQVEALRGDIEEWTLRAKTRSDFNTQEKAAFELQASRDKPELAFFEDVLALKIQGKPSDTVSFRFTSIDPADHKRAFSFDIDASSSSYTITQCQPSLPVLVTKPLLGKLNASRDLYTFIKEMRAAFVDSVQDAANERGGVYAR